MVFDLSQSCSLHCVASSKVAECAIYSSRHKLNALSLLPIALFWQHFSSYKKPKLSTEHSSRNNFLRLSSAQQRDQGRLQLSICRMQEFNKRFNVQNHYRNQNQNRASFCKLAACALKSVQWFHWYCFGKTSIERESDLTVNEIEIESIWMCLNDWWRKWNVTFIVIANISCENRISTASKV